MKKVVSIVLVLTLVLCLVASSFAAGGGATISVSVEGVPTLMMPVEGAPIKNLHGETVGSADKDDISLYSVTDFNDDENAAYYELMDFPEIVEQCAEDGEIEDEVTVIDGYTIWDVFKFDLSGVSEQQLYESPDFHVELNFEYENLAGWKIIVLEYIDGEWIALEKSLYEITDTGISIKLCYKGLVAILRIRGQNPVSPIVAPSVEMKGYPEIDIEEDEMFIDMWDNSHDPDSDVIWNIPLPELELTGAMNFVGEDLNAYNKMANAESLSAVCPNFNDTLAMLENAPDESSMVVRDLFKVTLLGQSKTWLDKEEENCVVLTFKYAIKEGDFFMVLEYLDGQWVAIDPSLVSVENGTVTVTLLNDGLLAFVVAV